MCTTKKQNSAVTTKHQFISKYPIPKKSKRLIIGTIHPHRVSDFELDFFYGNKNSLWSILSDAFPGLDFASVKGIVKTLSNHDTSITDIVRKCDRENETITQDSKLYNLDLNAEFISRGIKNSAIEEIYFTSGFSKNNAAKLFLGHFKIKHNSWDPFSREFVIPSDAFGRKIKAIVLYSPSGQANVGISKSKAYLGKREYYRDRPRPVNSFRIDFYREKFNFLREGQ
jgi:hypothetical protein